MIDFPINYLLIELLINFLINYLIDFLHDRLRSKSSEHGQWPPLPMIVMGVYTPPSMYGIEDTWEDSKDISWRLHDDF